MKFEDSGLPKDKLVEEAFKYSYANVMAQKKDALKNFTQQMDMEHQHQMMLLQMQKDSGQLTEDKFKQLVVEEQKIHQGQLQMGPTAVGRALEGMFADRRVGPAKELAAHGENTAPEILAAALLVDCVRSPVDFQHISKTFGGAVAGIVAEIVHADAYPSEREDNLAKAGMDTKRVYMALLVSGISQLGKQIEKIKRINPMQGIMLPPGEEESLFSRVQALWGTDKKLDARFVETFNAVGKVAGSPYKIELDDAGKPELVKGAFNVPPVPPMLPPPPPGPGGKKPGSRGGDIF